MKASDLSPALRAKLGIKARSKYNVAAKADRTADGIVFDSKAEMRWYLRLKTDPGVLFFLRQVPFHLPGNTVYRCDFMVAYQVGGVFPYIEFQDVKGMRTATYRLKKKQVEALYPIKIVEIQV